MVYPPPDWCAAVDAETDVDDSVTTPTDEDFDAVSSPTTSVNLPPARLTNPVEIAAAVRAKKQAENRKKNRRREEKKALAGQDRYVPIRDRILQNAAEIEAPVF